MRRRQTVLVESYSSLTLRAGTEEADAYDHGTVLGSFVGFEISFFFKRGDVERQTGCLCAMSFATHDMYWVMCRVDGFCGWVAPDGW